LIFYEACTELNSVFINRKIKVIFIFCLDAKEAKNQEKPYEIATQHSLTVFHA
jgi:hypothetical protein